jgi:hypothetical protein
LNFFFFEFQLSVKLIFNPLFPFRLTWTSGNPSERNVLTNFQDRRKPTAQVHVTFYCPLTVAPITEATLREIFERFGEVLDVTINRADFNQETGSHSGYGFIHYELSNAGVQAALTAIEQIHERLIGSVALNCTPSHGLETFLKSSKTPVHPSMAKPPSSAPVSPHSVNNNNQPPQMTSSRGSFSPTNSSSSAGSSTFFHPQHHQQQHQQPQQLLSLQLNPPPPSAPLPTSHHPSLFSSSSMNKGPQPSNPNNYHHHLSYGSIPTSTNSYVISSSSPRSSSSASFSPSNYNNNNNNINIINSIPVLNHSSNRTTNSLSSSSAMNLNQETDLHNHFSDIHFLAKFT